MNKCDQIKQEICECIKQYTNITDIPEQENMFEYMDTFQVLYTMIEIEKRVDIPLQLLLKQEDFRIMTIDSLVNKIYQLS